jgi:YfiH family protein
LVTVAVGLALSVITADCVPVLLATAEGHLAAIHAGWRGIAGGIVPVAARELPRDGQQVRAWIGPAIGPCCYEVEGDVARAVAEASSAEAVVPGAGRDGRPHLDLRLAVRHQLEREGFPSPRRLGPCTRCHPEWLHSYRGSGPAAGRNVAFIWRV